MSRSNRISHALRPPNQRRRASTTRAAGMSRRSPDAPAPNGSIQGVDGEERETRDEDAMGEDGDRCPPAVVCGSRIRPPRLADDDAAEEAEAGGHDHGQDRLDGGTDGRPPGQPQPAKTEHGHGGETERPATVPRPARRPRTMPQVRTPRIPSDQGSRAYSRSCVQGTSYAAPAITRPTTCHPMSTMGTAARAKAGQRRRRRTQGHVDPWPEDHAHGDGQQAGQHGPDGRHRAAHRLRDVDPEQGRIALAEPAAVGDHGIDAVAGERARQDRRSGR